MEKFELSAKEFKKMDDPINKGSGRTKYVCYIQASSIPESFDEWMATNPREQKMTTNVAKQITESLNENQYFHELNRGILMSVDSVKYDNQSDNVFITMVDPEIHGNVDGGHTLRAILDAKSKNMLSDDRYVFFEIFTGINSTVELAAARNTSVQVDLKSIEELKKSFQVIKEVYKDLPFFNRIAFKMNEHYNDEDVDIIDVREIIAITIMFSQELYPYMNAFGSLSEQQPIQCYSGKEASLKRFLGLGKEKREKMIKDMKGVITEIFELWDKVERNFAAESNKAGKRYGTRKYSKFNNNIIVGKAFFSQEPLQHIIPKGLMYPLVGSFRALIQIDNNGKYLWKKNPLYAWTDLASKLTTIILDERIENPEVIAKNSNLWSNLFKEVYIYGYIS